MSPQGCPGQTVDAPRSVRRDIGVPEHVRLELHTTGQLPKFPYILLVDPEQDGVSVGQRSNSQSFTGDNRALNYDVSSPGRIRLSWRLEWHSDSKAIMGIVLDGHWTIEGRRFVRGQLERRR